MACTPSGRVPLQPGGVTAKWAAPSPLVRVPGAAKTFDHMSSMGIR